MGDMSLVTESIVKKDSKKLVKLTLINLLISTGSPPGYLSFINGYILKSNFADFYSVIHSAPSHCKAKMSMSGGRLNLTSVAQ